MRERFINLKKSKPKLQHVPAKRFIIASFSRSLDSYHLRNELINLVGSIFYTDYLDADYSNLLNFLKNEEYHYVIKISNNGLADDYTVIQHGAEQENLIEIKVSLLNFLGLSTYLELCHEGINTDHTSALKKAKLF